MKKKLSIHDLARQLNVSSATVSFVLNGKAAEKRISRPMENKILRYAEKSGYRPNRVAKSLRTGKSKIIAMLMEGISDPFFSGIARIIEDEAYRNDYKIFYSSTSNDGSITKELIKVYRDTQVDAYIIAPPPGLEAEVQELIEDNFPVVLFDRYFPGLPTNNVIVDNFNGSVLAVRHFLENGYRNIGFITLDSMQTQMADRLLGYDQTIREHQLDGYRLKIPFGTGDAEAITKIRSFLQQHPGLDAVLFATNYLAISGLQAIADRGLRIPRDIAVVGFDDNTHFSLFSPSITAIAQPVQAISKHIIERLIQCLSGESKTLPEESTVLPVKLVIRESSVSPSSFIFHRNQNLPL